MAACNVSDYQFKLILQLCSISMTRDTRAEAERLKRSIKTRGEPQRREERSERGMLIRARLNRNMWFYEVDGDRREGGESGERTAAR